MSENKTSIVIGGSFSNLLAIAFIVLKLTHVIDWSWWWVLSPLWIPFAIVLLFVAIWLVLGMISALLEN